MQFWSCLPHDVISTWRAQTTVAMDAPTPRQQLMKALPELFPGGDNTEFRGNAAVTIGQMPVDWSASLLDLPVEARKAAIKAAIAGGWVLS
jgi:hypothetical protein